MATPQPGVLGVSEQESEGLLAEIDLELVDERGQVDYRELVRRVVGEM